MKEYKVYFGRKSFIFNDTIQKTFMRVHDQCIKLWDEVRKFLEGCNLHMITTGGPSFSINEKTTILVEIRPVVKHIKPHIQSFDLQIRIITKDDHLFNDLKIFLKKKGIKLYNLNAPDNLTLTRKRKRYKKWQRKKLRKKQRKKEVRQ